MNSSMFKLNTADFAKGLALAVIVVVFGAVQQGLTAHGFDFAAYDWAGIGKIAVVTAVSYITKNFFSTQDGKVFGRIG